MVEVTPTLNTAGTLTLKTRVPESENTFMDGIFDRASGVLHVSAYAVDQSLQGAALSANLFRATIEAATDHGTVHVIRGFPSGSNLEALTNPDGTIAAEKIAETPWAKVLLRLGYETRFTEGMMTSELSEKEFK